MVNKEITHSTEVSGDILIIRIAGDMFYENSKDLNKFFEQIDTEKNRKILINIKEVSWVDSMSLSILLALHKRVSSSGGRLILCNASSLVKKIMELTRLDIVITLSETEEEALKALS